MFWSNENLFKTGFRDINSDKAGYDTPERGDPTQAVNSNLIPEPRQPGLVWHWM